MRNSDKHLNVTRTFEYTFISLIGVTCQSQGPTFGRFLTFSEEIFLRFGKAQVL